MRMRAGDCRQHEQERDHTASGRRFAKARPSPNLSDELFGKPEARPLHHTRKCVCGSGARFEVRPGEVWARLGEVMLAYSPACVLPVWYLFNFTLLLQRHEGVPLALSVSLHGIFDPLLADA